LGMLFADLENDATATFLQPLVDSALPAMREALRQLEAVALEGLGGAAAADCVVSHSAELRYRGQMHSIRVPVNPLLDTAALRHEFETLYAKRYGHASSTAPVEFVLLGALATAVTPRPELKAMTVSVAQPAAGAATTARTRRVYLCGPDGKNQWRQVPVHDRGTLPIGFEGRGPAIIEDFGCTCFVDAGSTIEVGELGEIRLNLAQRNAT